MAVFESWKRGMIDSVDVRLVRSRKPDCACLGTGECPYYLYRCQDGINPNIYHRIFSNNPLANRVIRCNGGDSGMRAKIMQTSRIQQEVGTFLGGPSARRPQNPAEKKVSRRFVHHHFQLDIFLNQCFRSLED